MLNPATAQEPPTSRNLRARIADDDSYSISALTAEFRLTTRALRFYEEQGLIAPKRVGQTRIYTRRDRARIAWIVRAKNVGFSLSEIRELLDLYDLDDGRVTQRRAASERCREKIAQLERQRNDFDASIAELAAFVEQIESLELPIRR